MSWYCNMEVGGRRYSIVTFQCGVSESFVRSISRGMRKDKRGSVCFGSLAVPRWKVWSHRMSAVLQAENVNKIRSINGGIVEEQSGREGLGVRDHLARCGGSGGGCASSAGTSWLRWSSVRGWLMGGWCGQKEWQATAETGRAKDTGEGRGGREQAGGQGRGVRRAACAVRCRVCGP